MSTKGRKPVAAVQGSQVAPAEVEEEKVQGEELESAGVQVNGSTNTANNNASGQDSPIATSTPNTSTNTAATPSPTKLSRLDEKNALVGLNNRLAIILDKNRKLEVENGRLAGQVNSVGLDFGPIQPLHSAEESLTVTTQKLKTTFEKENGEVRKKLEEADKERVRLELARGNLLKDYEEVCRRLKSRDSDLQTSQNKLKESDSKLAAATGDLKKSREECNKLTKEKKEVQDENSILKQTQSDLRTQLEGETIAKLGLESKLNTSKQQMSLKSAQFEEQITTLTARKKDELKSVGEKLQKEYELKFEGALEKLRLDCSGQIAANKEEQENLYNMREEGLRRQVEKCKISLGEKAEEVEEKRKKLVVLEKRVGVLENEKRGLESVVKEMEVKLKEDGDMYKKEKSALEAEVKSVQEEREKLISEYQDLMEVKVALDNEIAVYRRLLEGEEERMGIAGGGE